MTRDDRGVVLRPLDALFRIGRLGGLTDAELLEYYSTRRDAAAEPAFAALVERHGPMVLRTCRALLRDAHEAEDAFQATFLILARKAGTLWVRDSLGPWLNQVALRTSSHLIKEAARRRRQERLAAGPEARGADGPDVDELGTLVREEVGRLPERYRAAVVSCLLEGLTPEQAALRLRCPAGTVRSRLARGRDRLRDRLRRRGLAPPTEYEPEPLRLKEPRTTVPAPLAIATVGAATRSATAGAIPATVASLIEGVLKMTFLARLKLATALLSIVVAIGAGVRAGQGAGEIQKVDPPARQTPPRRSPSLGQINRADVDFAGAKTLKDALELVKQELIRANRADFAALLSEERVCGALRSGIAAYETGLDEEEKQNPGCKEYFATVKPIFMKIAEERVWPPDSHFFAFFTLGGSIDGKPIQYDGFWLRLQVGTDSSKHRYGGFAMPIIDMAFGKLEFGR
jgi:RNA polymerase sigma factor (sigma-70 family)